MALDPILGQLLQSLREGGAKPTYEMELSEARAMAEAMAPMAFPVVDEVANVEDRMVGAVPIRIYTPLEASDVLTLFFHGGGFVIGNIRAYDPIARRLATLARSTVVSVEYRLAPEHPFPAAVEDTIEVLEWAKNAAASIVDSSQARLAVAGDSAGGNLAAVAALAARDRGIELAGQLLAYPATDSNPETPSMHRFAAGYFLEREEVIWFGEQYFQDESVLQDWRACPVLADAGSLAPALIGVAGYDPIRDFGVAYADHLRRADVAVVLRDYETLVHGFLSLGDIVPAAHAATVDLFTEFGRLLAGQAVGESA